MIITNGKIITYEHPNRILEDQAVLVQNGIIKLIDNQQQMLDAFPEEERLDAKGQLVMPGNICAHTHFYGAYSRGMAIPGAAPDSFPSILDKLWWPLDRSLSLEDVKYSAYVCILEAIQHGTTTLIDHHASQNAVRGSLAEIAKVVEETGIRASLCYEVTDRDGEERARQGIEENLENIRLVKNEKPLNGRLGATFGLHASLTLSEQTLEKCRQECPEDVGFHIHVAEHSVDQYKTQEISGLRVVDRLHKHGILGPRSIAVHAVHVDGKEMELLRDTGTWVTHQPRSNMNNAVGIAQIESMLRMGIKVCLGNDGFSNAMWEEWKTCYLAHKLWNLDPRQMGGYTVQEIAVYNNAALATQQFGGEVIGQLIPGAKADIILVDYKPFTPMTEGNLPWHILFGFHESMVTTTIVDGNVLMKDREILTVDVDKVFHEALKVAPALWQRYQAKFAN